MQSASLLFDKIPTKRLPNTMWARSWLPTRDNMYTCRNVRLIVGKERQILDPFICSLDDMHDSQATPPIVVKSGSGDMRVTFPPWFGETLSDARVAPGMKCNWTLKAVWKPQRRGGAVGAWVAVWVGCDELRSQNKLPLTGRQDLVKDSCV